jgi:hypothetical protein
MGGGTPNHMIHRQTQQMIRSSGSITNPAVIGELDARQAVLHQTQARRLDFPAKVHTVLDDREHIPISIEQTLSRWIGQVNVRVAVPHRSL